MVWEDLIGFGVPWARLPELVWLGDVLPLWAMNTYPMCWHPGTPDALMCGPHQSDGNPTLGISARP